MGPVGRDAKKAEGHRGCSRKRPAARRLTLATAGSALAATLAGCGGAHQAAKVTTSTPAPVATTTVPSTVPVTVPASTATSAPPTTTTTITVPTTTTTAPTTTTTVPFPAVIEEAMETMQPRPAGLEAPDMLPSAPAAVSAEASGLGGTYSVTLIATPTVEPVNSPQLGASAANSASDLGTFSTIPSSSPATAAGYLRSSAAQDISACSGADKPLVLGSTAAVTCPTAQGPAVNWAVGHWKVQVQNIGGREPALASANTLASWLRGDHLPAAADGLISVAVPGTPEAGTATHAVILWAQGADVYQTSAPGTLEALYLATWMKPWP